MAVSSHGTMLKVRDGGAYLTIAEVLDIDGPTATVVASTAHSVDALAAPEVIVDGFEPGTIELSVNFIGDGTQALLRDAMYSASELEFRVEFPTPGMEAIEFRGLVVSFGTSIPVDGVLTANLVVTQTTHAAYV